MQFFSFSLRAQGNFDSNVPTPFDSIFVNHISTAVDTSQVLTISMDFSNSYSKSVKLHFALGGYEGLGIEDDKGRKYKIYTSENLVGTDQINKGYMAISSVQFGDKMFHSFTYVEQDIAAGQSRKLIIKVKKFDRSVQEITDFHIRCILSVNYSQIGDKIFQLHNLKTLRSSTLK
jgi:hypothetical protein